MNKTHLEVVEDADIRLNEAVVNVDNCALQNLSHPDIVYTNENGEVFSGHAKMPFNNPKLFRIDELQTLERNISLFNNVAVVTTMERRAGYYLGMQFSGLYSSTRMWKFNRQWQLIAVTSVLI